MANHQHGRNSPGGRNPGGRTLRAIPAGRAGREVRTPSQSGVPSYIEPEVRRWPHPLEDTLPAPPEPEPVLHYIRCALSYQNQLLADIKTLLEQLTADRAAAGSESAEQKQPEL